MTTRKETTRNTNNKAGTTTTTTTNDLPKMDHIKGFNDAALKDLPDLPDFYIMDEFDNLHGTIEVKSKENLNIDINIDDKDDEFFSFPNFSSYEEYSRFMSDEIEKLPKPPFTINPVTYLVYKSLYKYKDVETKQLVISYRLSISAIIMSITTSVLVFIGLLVPDYYIIIGIIQLLTALLTLCIMVANVSVNKYLQGTITNAMLSRPLQSPKKVNNLDTLILELKRKNEKEGK